VPPDLQIAAWRWALLTFCANASVVGGRHFRSGADVTRFWTCFWPQFHSNIRHNLLLGSITLYHEPSSLWDHFCNWNMQVPKLVKTVSCLQRHQGCSFAYPEQLCYSVTDRQAMHGHQVGYSAGMFFRRFCNISDRPLTTTCFHCKVACEVKVCVKMQ